MSKAIRQRNDRVSGPVRVIAWKAQQRLHKRLVRLREKGKPATRAVTEPVLDALRIPYHVLRDPDEIPHVVKQIVRTMDGQKIPVIFFYQRRRAVAGKNRAKRL